MSNLIEHFVIDPKQAHMKTRAGEFVHVTMNEQDSKDYRTGLYNKYDILDKYQSLTAFKREQDLYNKLLFQINKLKEILESKSHLADQGIVICHYAEQLNKLGKLTLERHYENQQWELNNK